MPAPSALKTVEGDLVALALAGLFDVVAHGCNCMGAMDAGLAKAIKAKFPEACAADLATLRGDRGKLGTCSFALVERDGRALTIVNAYTQFDYRGRGPLVDYDAVRKCMAWIKERHAGRRIGLPLIGAGLAGGDWPRIAAIIAHELAGEDVTIVTLPGASRP